MARFIFKAYKKMAEIIALPLQVAYFFRPTVGKEYQFGFRKKVYLMQQFRRNTATITSASDWLEHLQMAACILQIPRSLSGHVAECGSYKGGSTANLSLVCAIVGRTLYVFDSFEGLPQPQERDICHEMAIKDKHKTYEQGQYSGSLEEVKENIRRYGNLNSCIFVKGFYEDTLPKLQNETFVFIFLDVDLHSSLETCLRFLWPRLTNSCYLFSHEAQDMPYVSLFFDSSWWRANVQEKAPGFIGAGTGLPLGIAKGSSIGYTKKAKQN